MNVEETLIRLGLALAVGLLIGVERGWRERGMKEGERTAGFGRSRLSDCSAAYGVCFQKISGPFRSGLRFSPWPVP